MFSRVIIAADLSEASDQIVVNLRGLTALGTKEVILAHAMDIAPQSISAPGFDYYEALRGDLSLRAQARLLKLEKVVSAQGFQTSSRLIYGMPAVAIDSLARTVRASLVIAGSRGASLAKDVGLGGSAMEILQHSRVPVLLQRMVRNRSDSPCEYRVVGRNFPRHVLHPTDFSPTADRAFNHLLENMVDQCGSAVTLLHVGADSSCKSSFEVREQLARRSEALLAAGATKVTVQIRTGAPSQQIAAVAKARHNSLILLGTQGQGFIDELFLGSTCRELVRTAPVPILTIPPLATAATIGTAVTTATEAAQTSDL